MTEEIIVTLEVTVDEDDFDGAVKRANTMRSLLHDMSSGDVRTKSIRRE